MQHYSLALFIRRRPGSVRPGCDASPQEELVKACRHQDLADGIGDAGHPEVVLVFQRLVHHEKHTQTGGGYILQV